MSIYYTEYITYQIYSKSSPAVIVGAPQMVGLENKSKVESNEQKSPHSCSVMMTHML
jgi:hypothetical protein